MKASVRIGKREDMSILISTRCGVQLLWVVPSRWRVSGGGPSRGGYILDMVITTRNSNSVIEDSRNPVACMNRLSLALSFCHRNQYVVRCRTTHGYAVRKSLTGILLRKLITTLQ